MGNARIRHAILPYWSGGEYLDVVRPGPLGQGRGAKKYVVSPWA